MIKEIILKDRRIEYELQIKAVKNINLRIKADRTVFVSASPSVSEKTIEEFLVSKSDYILNALEYYEDIAKYAPKPKQYVDGESFRIFGHDRRLIVVKGTNNAVESDESYITLTVKDISDIEQKRKTMEQWRYYLCKDKIQSLCEAVYPKFQKYGVSYPVLRFRNMVSRWGSCQPKRGVLTFNYALVEAPIFSIEYVVVHEFTHFLQPDHSHRFYQQLAMFMPDWEERKRILEMGNYFVE